MQYIDIHSHLAWDIDDGIESKEQAYTAVVNAKKDGISKIIATPHFIPGRQSKSDTDQMNERIEQLKELARTEDIDIYTGCELFLNENYLEMIEEESFNTLAGSGYLLCEFDVRKNIDENDQAEEMLYEISIRDMIPVIAHVERYFHNELDIQRISEWNKLGYIIQINRTSLLGMHGTQIKKNAWRLLKSGYAHVIASDAHAALGNRICKLSDIYGQVLEVMGKDNADILFYRNPLHIIENEEVEEIQAISEKSFLFKRLRRRKS